MSDGARLVIAMLCWAAGTIAVFVIEDIWRDLPQLAIGLGMMAAAAWGAAFLIVLAPDDWLGE